jgi:ketosteroid isomerase-like protein
MATDNKQIIADAYAAMASGHVKGFLAALDPEIVVREPASLPHGGEYHGIPELLGMFGKATKVLGGPLVVDSLTAEEDRVAAVIRVPLADGSAEALIAEHWVLRDGKAVSLDVFWQDTSIAS